MSWQSRVRPGSWSRLFCAAILLLALLPSAHLAWNSRDMPHFGHLHDDSVYFVCAKSLAEGSGYRLLSFPGQPWQTKYPPLFPLLLALIWKINPAFPDNLVLATLLAWLMLPVFLIAARSLLADLKIGWVTGWILCAVLALSPYVNFTSITLMSELMFCALLFSSLTLAQRARRPWHATAAGLFGGAAYLTRTTALPLLLTSTLWFLYRKQYRRAALFFTGMLPAVAGWNLWSRFHLSGVSDPALLWYSDYFGFYRHDVSWQDLPLVVWNNLDGFASALSGLIFFNFGDGFWGGSLMRIVAIASIAGAIRLAARNGATHYHLFALGFAPLLLLYHYRPDERYVLPLGPLFLAGSYFELRHISRMLVAAWNRSGFVNRAASALALAGMALFGFLAISVVHNNLFKFLPAVVNMNRQQLASNLPAYEWIRRNVRPECVLFAHFDPTLYLYTGRQACRRPVFRVPYYRGDRERVLQPYYRLADFAREQNLPYLFLTSMDFDLDLPVKEAGEVREALAKEAGLRAVYQSAKTSVYQVQRAVPAKLIP